MQRFFKTLLQRNHYPFSAGYFSHRPSQTNNDSTPFDFTPENYKVVETLLTKYPSNWKRSAIIPLLTLAQKQNDNFLSLSAMRKVAKITEVNEMDVYEVASFYTMFNREKVGKYHLQVCGTTPCQLRGS
jgi:NADH dehydrogenase (ubiquinone) flavoprotein 2